MPGSRYVEMVAWYCPYCDVMGRSPAADEPVVCWYCGTEEIVETARPTIRQRSAPGRDADSNSIPAER